MVETPEDKQNGPKPGPKPDEKPQQQDSQEDSDTPPWGDNFDPHTAWKLIENLRGDKAKQKTALEQAAADREELDRLRTERLTADEKALKEATDKAAEAARAEAAATWGPKYLTSELKSAAAQVINDPDQLKSFMAFADPSKFTNDDGEIDEEKVMGHLTALYVGRDTQQQRQAPQWGQHSGNGQPPKRPGDDGRAALEKRHGVKNSS